MKRLEFADYNDMHDHIATHRKDYELGDIITASGFHFKVVDINIYGEIIITALEQREVINYYD